MAIVLDFDKFKNRKDREHRFQPGLICYAIAFMIILDFINDFI